jgi:hypothetical protein
VRTDANVGHGNDRPTQGPLHESRFPVYL